MRPLEIRIAGSFYDSQIYSGELYLWTTAGAIVRVDWNKLVDSVEKKDQYRATFEFAFRRSEYLYDPNVAILLHDPEVRSVLERRFRALSESPIEVSTALLESCTIAQYDNPFGFPHADSGFYNGNIFVGGRDGVEYAWPMAEDHAMQPTKLTDLPALGIALGSSRLAIAAGSEGVFQLTAAPDIESNLKMVAPSFSNWVRWMESALFASNRSSAGTFVDFKPGKKNEDRPERPREKVVRQLLPVEELGEFHEQVDYVWGGEDRLCIAATGHIDVVKFFPRRKLVDRFKFQGRVEVSTKGPHHFIAADNAVFGFVLEHATGLVVLSSSSETISLEGEPVNWRVFPRSKYYTNQLHVVREEYISVLSFNNDFFVNQDEKLSGVNVNRNAQIGKRLRFGRPEPLVYPIPEERSGPLALPILDDDIPF
jgi:hypothetical protein